MKKDTEIRLYLQERRKGMTQRVAAARAGIGERTARKYEQAAALPSQLKRQHDSCENTGWREGKKGVKREKRAYERNPERNATSE